MPASLRTNVFGVRNEQVAQKIALHLCCFQQFIEEVCDPQRHISLVTKQEIVQWQSYLDEDVGFARATTNSHMASLSGFYTWVYAQRPDLFAMGNPCAGIGELPLQDLEPQALNPDQVKRLKEVCDRLPSFHESKTKRYQQRRSAGKVSEMRLHAHARPYRDRAMVYVLLSTGLRREELVMVNVDQVEPHPPEQLREAERARITRVRGKRKSMRTLWLSKDARAALADYVQGERATDAAAFAAMGEDTAALFLRASNVTQSKPPKDAERGGRLAVRAVNYLVEHIGALYNAELAEGDKLRIRGKLHAHTLRHTFAYLPIARKRALMPTSYGGVWGTARSATSSSTPVHQDAHRRWLC